MPKRTFATYSMKGRWCYPAVLCGEGAHAADPELGWRAEFRSRLWTDQFRSRLWRDEFRSRLWTAPDRYKGKK